MVTGLLDGHSYRFTVTAVNSVGAGGASAATPAVTPAPVPGIAPAPTVARGNLQATVSWRAPAANGTAPIIGYRVVASPGGRSCTTAASGRCCTVTGLVNGRRYLFTVVAINRIGAGPPSLETAAVPATAAAPVRSLAATFPAAQRTVLTWAVPAATGGLPVTRYQYRTSADNGRTWSRWVSVGVVRSATLTGLAKGHAYLADVRAVTGFGGGAAARVAVRPTR